MKLSVHFLEAEGSLAAWHDAFRSQTDSVAQRIDARVPAALRRHPVDIVVQYLPERTIPELGIGGSCFRRGMVTVNVDPGSAHFETHLAQGVFSRTLAHELHHAMRWNACGYGLTLGEALVSEGLADVFAETVTGLSAAPWCHVLRDGQTGGAWERILDRAERERGESGYNHAAWFFGTGELPRWVGYTIGYRLACLYRDAHPADASTGMIDAPPDAVLAFWATLRQELSA